MCISFQDGRPNQLARSRVLNCAQARGTCGGYFRVRIVLFAKQREQAPPDGIVVALRARGGRHAAKHGKKELRALQVRQHREFMQ